MAELNTKSSTDKTKKVRIRKTAPNVDLTAMVDLAFLLITFFMLTTTLNKPNSLDVAMPDNTSENTQDMDERRVVSLLLGEKQITWYHGDFNKPLSSPQIVKNKGELRNILATLNSNIHKTTEGKDMVVLIKPSKEARAFDIIQALDEMKVSKIKRYMIGKISLEEEHFLFASK